MRRSVFSALALGLSCHQSSFALPQMLAVPDQDHDPHKPRHRSKGEKARNRKHRK